MWKSDFDHKINTVSLSGHANELFHVQLVVHANEIGRTNDICRIQIK